MSAPATVLIEFPMSQTPKFHRLLNPKTIAVVGGSWAAAVIEQCERMGFEGEIWPVHPSKTDVRGRRAYASIDALPAAPDATFVGVNRAATLEVVRALSARGAGGATCFAAGWAEVEAEGEAMQAALLEAAGDMPIFGPNCYGLINYCTGATLWPDVHGGSRVERGAALICQSSNIAINLTMQRRALPLSFVLTVGNGAQVGLGDMIEELAADERVTSIGLYIEGFGDPARFAQAVAAAHARGVGVVAIKAGQSEGGQALALTHTASLAGGAAVASAFLARTGVAEVATLPTLLETLKVLHFKGALDNRRVISVSCSGGEAGLMADLGAAAGLEFPALSEAEAARIGESLNPLVTVSNPFDYNTFDWGDSAALGAMWAGIMALDVAHPMLVIDWPAEGTGPTHTWDVAIEAVGAALNGSDRRAGVPALVASLPENMPGAAAEKIAGLGLVPGHGLDEHLQAVAGAAQIGGHRRALANATVLPVQILPGGRASGSSPMLDEAAAKTRLGSFGIPVPEHRTCASVEEAVAAVVDFGHAGTRCAMKILGDFPHKTELGGVRLGLGADDLDAVRSAARALLNISGAVLVEPMADKPVVEMILGVAQDPALGLHVVLGAGGVLTEILADSEILLFPYAEADVRAALERLRIWPLLAGYRGAAGGDVSALVGAVMALGDFVQAHADRLIELDINPLFVHAATEASGAGGASGAGVMAVDALVRMTD